MSGSRQPSLDVIIERLQQNTKITQEVQKQVTEGFKALNGRIGATERRLDTIDIRRELEKEELEEAREKAKSEIIKTAEKAKDDVDKPDVGSNKWMLAFLAGLVMALVGIIATSMK